MVESRERTISWEHRTYVPSCGWDLDENGLPPMSREEKLMKDELEWTEILTNQAVTNAIRKVAGLEPLSNRPFGADPIYFKSEKDFMKQHETIVKERKNTMHPEYNSFDSAFGYGAKNFENPIVNGVQFGPNDDVYLFVNGDKCQIYPKDKTAKREVSAVRNLNIQEFMKVYQEKNGKPIPGGKINRLQKALAKWRHMLTPFSTKQFNGLAFNRIIFSDRATILLGDKDKTVVKCMDGEHYDPEKALLTALFIREYGKNAYHDLMDICHETYVECGEPNKPKSKKKTAKKVVSKTKNR